MTARMYFREDSQRDKTISDDEWEKRYKKSFPDAPCLDTVGVAPLSYQAYLEKRRRVNVRRMTSLKNVTITEFMNHTQVKVVDATIPTIEPIPEKLLKLEGDTCVVWFLEDEKTKLRQVVGRCSFMRKILLVERIALISYAERLLSCPPNTVFRMATHVFASQGLENWQASPLDIGYSTRLRHRVFLIQTELVESPSCIISIYKTDTPYTI